MPPACGYCLATGCPLNTGKDHVDLHIEAERELATARIVIANLQASLPVGVAPKGRWATALYCNGYWWVKKSHAERALKDERDGDPHS